MLNSSGSRMRTLENLCIAIELTVASSALVFPKVFVAVAEFVLASFPMGPENSIHYAYGLLLAFLFSISSFVRKFWAAGGPLCQSVKIHWFNGVVVVGAIAMFYSIITSVAGQVTSEEVVTPYSSYLISVLFCIGVGYVVSDLLVFSILRTEHRRKGSAI